MNLSNKTLQNLQCINNDMWYYEETGIINIILLMQLIRCILNLFKTSNVFNELISIYQIEPF